MIGGLLGLCISVNSLCVFYFSPEKASAVLAPLLTPQAIELLENCLSSKESEVWKVLGPNWIYPKYVNVRFPTIIPITIQVTCLCPGSHSRLTPPLLNLSLVKVLGGRNIFSPSFLPQRRSC